MNFEKMLKKTECECGMIHTCDIKHIVISSGAINELKTFLGEYKNVLLVADNNTYAVCGQKVKEQLADKMDDVLIFERDGLLVPNEEAIAEMQSKLTEKTDLIIGIGSGVIQDICKFVSFGAGLPYFIVATAPSMDGYASKGAAMITDNMKVTYNTHVPEVIIGDVDILKNAPIEMIQSGYGDICGKFSCLNDWKLSRVVNDEYFCRNVYDLTYEMLIKTKDLGAKLLARDSDAIGMLMESLVGVGIAMAYVGNSRPASGSEHHLSHFFEITGLLDNAPYFMHGTDVIYSAVYTQKIRERILEMNKTETHEKSAEKYESEIRRIYGKAAEGVLDLQKKLGWYEIDRLPVYREKWHEIKEVLREAPSSEEMTGYAESIGLDISEFEKMYGEKKITDAISFAKDLKDRYTVLWMYYDLMPNG